MQRENLHGHARWLLIYQNTDTYNERFQHVSVRSDSLIEVLPKLQVVQKVMLYEWASSSQCFKKNVVLASSGSCSPMVYPEDEGGTIHHNTGNYLPKNTTLTSRKTRIFNVFLLHTNICNKSSPIT
jgi:hypothetical protein